MKNAMIGRDAGTWIGIAGGIAAIAAAVFYVFYGVDNMLVLIPLLAGIVLEAVSVFADYDILTILSPVCCMASLCVFVMDSVYIFVAYFFNLAMFGDITQIGAVSRICILTGAAVLLLLVASFVKKGKEK